MPSQQNGWFGCPRRLSPKRMGGRPRTRPALSVGYAAPQARLAPRRTRRTGPMQVATPLRRQRGRPNTPLSSRGRGATAHLGKPDCGPGLLQRLVRHGLRPNKAATTGLPHHGPSRDRTLRRAARPHHPSDPAAATGTPRRRGRSGAALRLPPPTTPTARPPSSTDNHMSATESQNPVGGGVPNTPLSSRGRLGRHLTARRRYGGPGRLQRMVRLHPAG